MNSGSPRLLVIPNADLQMENQEPGSYLDQLLTFRKKKSPLEKAKSVILDIGRTVKKVSVAVHPHPSYFVLVRDPHEGQKLSAVKCGKVGNEILYFSSIYEH